VVITRAVDPGQAVAAALQAPELFVLAEDLDSMRVIAAIDEADVGRVAPGQPAHFTVDAYPDEQFAADVFELHSAPIITQDVVTYEAVLTVANPGRRLRPGMTASVKVVTARAVGAVVVPNAALRFTPPGAPRPAHRGVWTTEAAAGLRFVPVELVVDDGTRSAVRGALHPGDTVVVGTREDAS
jgi:HlyD family secretion protein